MASKIVRRYLPSVERRLLKLYFSADALTVAHGANWYARQHKVCEELAHQYGIETEQACAVIAALSPGRAWELNVKDAESVIREYANGKRGRKLSLVGTYGWRNMTLAERVLSGNELIADILLGPKVYAFFCCLLLPDVSTHVVIDRHAKQACLGDWKAENQVVKNSEYDYFAGYYRRVAKKVGCLPLQAQAIIWIVYRREQAQKAIRYIQCPGCPAVHNLEQYSNHCSLDCLNAFYAAIPF